MCTKLTHSVWVLQYYQSVIYVKCKTNYMTTQTALSAGLNYPFNYNHFNADMVIFLHK